MTVQFAAEMIRSDYGVPGSPVWWEPNKEWVTSVEILGVDFDYAKLPKELQDEIAKLSEGLDWEPEEQEYD